MSGQKFDFNINHIVLNGIADLVRVIDKDNNVIFVNSAMKEFFGADETTMTCEPGDGFFCNVSVAQRSFRTGEIIQREEYIKGNYYSVKCSPVHSETGQIVGVVEVFRNVTMEKKLQGQIINKNKELTFEMLDAQKIQKSLIPEKGFFKNLKLDYFYSPSNILSGDLFNVFEINEDNMGIYIADVMGHGFKSSLITMFISLLFKNISTKTLLSPSRTLEEIKSRFSSLNIDPGIYFTCFYGVYNRKKDNFLFSNAGHNPCPILTRDRNSYELISRGFPISGIFDHINYEENSVDLFCGDKLLFMTDGIVETVNKNREPFGLERIADILNENSIDEINVIKEELELYKYRDQQDDITCVLFKVL